MRLAAFVAFALVGLAFAPNRGAFREGNVSDQWFLARLGESPVGYVHRTVRMALPGQPGLLEVVDEQYLRVQRDGKPFVVQTTTKTTERETGEILRRCISAVVTGIETRTDISIEGGRASIVSEVAGKRSEQTIDGVKEPVSEHGALQRVAKIGLAPGAVYSFDQFSEEKESPARLTVTVGKWEEIVLLGGKKESLVKVDLTGDAYPKSVWMTMNGVIERESQWVLGMELEYLVADEATARSAASSDTKSGPDISKRSSTAEAHVIPHPRLVEEAIVVVSPKHEGITMPDFADGRQAVEAQYPDGSIRLRIRRRVPAATNSVRRPIEDPSPTAAAFLEPGTLVQSDAPEIKKLADEIVGDEKDAWKAAQVLEQWVGHNMSASAEPIGEESALDVCRNRKGDCTEYAVFLCALCRAASIPCRTVTGLVYTRGIWGLHEWVEVLIGDDWWPLDATIGRGFVDALHLTMTREAADGIGSISEWIATRQAFGNLGVSIESLTLRGRKLPDLERKDRALPDGRHVDSVLGIAYRVPDGMEGHVPALPARGVLVIARPGASQNDFSMRIEFTEASVILDWDRITMAKELKVPPVIRDGFVDGRPARIETFDDDVTVRHVWVQDEDILYDFSAHNIREEADSRAFDAFVESLDLDAVPPD